MSFYKKIFTIILLALLGWIGSLIIIQKITTENTYANAPSFEKNYVDYLMNKKWDNPNGNETLRDLSAIGIHKDMSLMDNLKNIFYPDSLWQWGKLRDILKVIGFVVFVAMLVRQWFQYAMQADDEKKISSFHINFAYIFMGGLIFFGATWLLWVSLNIWWDGWSAALLNKLDGSSSSIMFQIFSWIRAGVFFIAIMLLWFTWWKMITALDDEKKLQTGRQWILNIVISLIIIKIIDYIYFVAQNPDFKSKAVELIVEVSKVLWYILWGFFTITLIYYGFRLMFSNGDDEGLKKVQSVITAVFLWSLVLFIFFLIIYQITQEFA